MKNLRGLCHTIVVIIAVVSCNKFDNLQQQIDNQNARTSELEALCSQMNQDVNNLITITNALQENDYVESVEDYMKGGKVIGHTIRFKNAGSITLLNGKDDDSPALGIKEENDIYFWTLDGNFIKDENGNKLPVSGITPKFKIENNKWYVSYDEGKAWMEVGVATCISPICGVLVTDGAVSFLLSDGSSIKFPLNGDVPFSIVMLTEGLDELHKGDTVSVFIRVNPSDFPINENSIELFVSHDMYTCYSKGGKIEGRVFSGADYDSTATSEFKVIGLREYEKQDGIYEIAVKVDGEGNYYDDARVYAVASSNKRSVCSSSPCHLNVTPRLSEGIFVDSPVQSFHPTSKALGNHIDTNAIKPFYIGLWSQYYVNKLGELRVYDRSGISVTSCSDTLSSFNSSTYQQYGIVSLTPFPSEEFWQNYIESGDESVTIEGARLRLQKIGAREENAEFPFKYKYLTNSEMVSQMEISMSKDQEIINGETEFDYNDFKRLCGYDEFVSPWFGKEVRAASNEGCIFIFSDLKKPDDFTFELSFFGHSPFVGCHCFGCYLWQTVYSNTQGPDGSSVELPDCLDLITVAVYKEITIVE